MPIPRLSLEHTALLVVDVQEKLLPHIHNAAAVAQQVGRLIDGAKMAGLPILVTEQYPKGLGPTAPGIAAKLERAGSPRKLQAGEARSAAAQAGKPSATPANLEGYTPIEKLKFSAWVEPVRAGLAASGARSVLVCGIEAHVCVMQTCLDLIDNGYVTAVAVDAIGSRRRADQDAAVERLIQAGVLPTTVESALLELVREASGPLFKSILTLIR